MPHEINLITTIAAALGLAMVMGFAASRLKMPPLVGYLVAGIVIGPATPGFVADVGLASQLAEIGVMLLMFGVGLHFSLGDLMAVRRIAVPGAVVQIAAATALGVATALLWGWAFGAALVFGLALSVASTVVLLRALDDRGVLDSINGRIAVGWLVVEDLVMVLVLVLLPPIAGLLGSKSDIAVSGGEGHVWTTLGITLAKVTAFIALMLVAGRRVFPRLLWLVARTGSRELFTLCVIAVAVGVAYGAAALFGVSFALGAFFSGMMMRESEFSHRAAEESLPLRDAFSVLFFVSVGMLFEPQVLIERAAEGPRRGCDHHGGQDGGRNRAGACVSLSAQYGADGRRESGADRRVLVHSGRSGRRAWDVADGGSESHSRRRADIDRAQLARVRRHRARSAVASGAIQPCTKPGAQRRPTRRTADDC